MRIVKIRFKILWMLLLVPGVILVPCDTPLSDMHPSMELINFRPNELEPQVTGIDWLSNGDMVFSHWNGIHGEIEGRQMEGIVYIMKGAMGDDPGNVTYHAFAENLEDVLGLVVVDDEIYISGGTTLQRLVDTDGDEIADRYDTIWHADLEKSRHEFFFGLLHDEGKLIGSLGVERGGPSHGNPNRGTWISVDIATGEFEVHAAGFRQPNGVYWGPDGELFAPDVQGDWLPSCKLNHLVEGRFYGFKRNIAEGFDNLPDTDPAIYLPQIEMCRAPSNPLVLREGPYAGQMIMGDVAYGGLARIFLEKVAGEYQGAVFDFAGGIEAGVQRSVYGPDGHIYLGGMGSMGGWWGWNDPSAGWRLFGFQKIKHIDGSAFEMKAVRSLNADALEIEFSEPASDDAANTGMYSVVIWRYESTSNYGGPKLDEDTLVVVEADLSADRMKVSLTVAGLKEGFVTYIEMGNIESQAGENLWINRTYYTMNNFGPGEDVSVPVIPDSPDKPKLSEWEFVNGGVDLKIKDDVNYTIDLFNIQGQKVKTFSSAGPGVFSLPAELASGVYTVQGNIGNDNVTGKMFQP